MATGLASSAPTAPAIIHCLIVPKRVFDRLAASVENVWPLRYAGLHSIQNGLVLKTRQKGSSRFSRARIMAVQAPVSARSFSCRSRADLAAFS
ncbi:MAG TPA: hypothetical protein VJ349_11855 [Stellaceae bacterium]|nr:hypothetical protein [Stellaceae bacterium]